MVQRVVAAMIRSAGWCLLAALGLALVFAVWVGWQTPGSFSLYSFQVGLSATLALLMLMEPPRSILQPVLQHPGLPMVIYGWLICVIGWLLLPLFIGVMIDVVAGVEESELVLRMRLYKYGLHKGIPADEIDQWVEQRVRSIRKIMSEDYR